MKHCQIVMGAAGAGKSSYCAAFQQHCLSTRRTVHIMNCDPAAEGLAYEPSIDIRELVSLDDVEETLDLGPNGPRGGGDFLLPLTPASRGAGVLH